MKKYTTPMANIVAFDIADIITSSFITLSWGDFKSTSDVDDESGL